MTKRWNVRVYFFSLMLLPLVFALAAAQGQQAPRGVTIGSNPAGTVFYAVASAFSNGSLPLVTNSTLAGRGWLMTAQA